jgi:hypothetical protein
MRKSQEVTAKDVAAYLHTTPRKVSVRIEAGLLPIGYVEVGKTRRTIIVPGRWEAYKRGELT